MINGRFFEECFLTEIYKPVRELGDIEVCIDVGACTGEFSLWVYPQAKHIYAVEANRDNYDNLFENTRDLPRIDSFHVALCGENKEIKLYGMNKTPGGDIILPVEHEFQFVRGMTLAAFMEEQGIKTIDCLKIDIENGEKMVFDAPDFGSVAPKIRYIIGEHFDDYIQSLLKKYGFTLRHYDHGMIAERILV